MNTLNETNICPIMKSLLLNELSYEAVKFKRFNLVSMLLNYKIK